MNLKNLKSQKHADTVIEDTTAQRPSEVDGIPINHPLRKLRMLTFRQYTQATGYLPESMHVDLSEMNDRQLEDYVMIADRHAIRASDQSKLTD